MISWPLRSLHDRSLIVASVAIKEKQIPCRISTCEYAIAYCRLMKCLGPQQQEDHLLQKMFAFEVHHSRVFAARRMSVICYTGCLIDTQCTWTPPGRLTDARWRTASWRELASTFHFRGKTWSEEVWLASGTLWTKGGDGHFCDSSYYKIRHFWVVSIMMDHQGMLMAENLSKRSWAHLVLIARTEMSLFTRSIVPATEAITYYILVELFPSNSAYLALHWPGHFQHKCHDR